MSTAVLIFAAQVVLGVLLIAIFRYGKPPEAAPKLPERPVSRVLPQKKSRRGGR